jgi:hypothetical protein
LEWKVVAPFSLSVKKRLSMAQEDLVRQLVRSPMLTDSQEEIVRQAIASTGGKFGDPCSRRSRKSSSDRVLRPQEVGIH